MYAVAYSLSTLSGHFPALGGRFFSNSEILSGGPVNQYVELPSQRTVMFRRPLEIKAPTLHPAFSGGGAGGLYGTASLSSQRIELRVGSTR